MSDPSDLYQDHIFLHHAHDRNARRTRWVVALTLVTMVVEVVAGYAFGSMALLADGFHMATHAGALAVAAAAYAYARRNASDPRFSFGTGKVGDLAGFASALILAIAALGIGGESVSRLLTPGRVAFTEAAIVAVLGLLVNIVSAILLWDDQHHDHDHSHGHGHGHGPDNNLRGAYMHVLADALTSVMAIVALLAGRYFGWVWLDAAVGIVGAIVILRWSWSLMRDTAAVLLDTIDAPLLAQVRDRVERPGDVRIIDLHVWRVGPGAFAAIVSVVGGADTDTAAIRARVADIPRLAHVTVECH
jgi:cation diffusion facilitator family transporter